jgi:hypothetical protein
VAVTVRVVAGAVELAVGLVAERRIVEPMCRGELEAVGDVELGGRHAEGGGRKGKRCRRDSERPFCGIIPKGHIIVKESALKGRQR